VACFAVAVTGPARADEIVPQWMVPERLQGPNVFGTVALPARTLPTSTRWTKLMRASVEQPGLLQFVAGAWDLAPQDQVAFVQSAVNHAVRTSAFENCSDLGYWRPAQETLARGRGNCFDVAIAKMEALRLLGLRGPDMYLTTGYVRYGLLLGQRRESAALLVRTGESYWLLTDHSDTVIEALGNTTESSGFTPMLTYGMGTTWIHGRLVKADPPQQESGQGATVAAAR